MQSRFSSHHRGAKKSLTVQTVSNYGRCCCVKVKTPGSICQLLLLTHEHSGEQAKEKGLEGVLLSLFPIGQQHSTVVWEARRRAECWWDIQVPPDYVQRKLHCNPGGKEGGGGGGGRPHLAVLGAEALWQPVAEHLGSYPAASPA